MELRKIQVTGGNTHIVSLPKKWIDRNGLQRGETLAIHEEPDGSLLIVPYGDARPRQRSIVIEVKAAEKDDDVVRRLVGAYLAGADTIRLETRGEITSSVRQVVTSTIRDLVGVEIVDEGPDHIILQDLVGVSDMDLRKTVSRMQRIARVMFDEALTALERQDAELGREVSGRDDDLDRLEWHVSKQMHALLEQPRLAARLQIRPAEALNLTLVARSVERIGDHASKICKNLADEPVPQEVLEMLIRQGDVVRQIWDRAFGALTRNDFDQGSAAADEGRAAAGWKATFSQRLRDLPGELAEPLTIIADSLDRVRGYSVDIAEIAMNQTFQKWTE